MFFILAKLLFIFLSPFNLLVFLAAGAGGAFCLKWRRMAAWMGGLALGILLVFGVLPVGAWTLQALETKYVAPAPLPEKVDGIILLGGFIDTNMGMAYGTPQLDGGVDRLDAFVDLARAYPMAKLVFTSGQGTIAQAGTPEARLLEPLLDRMHAADITRRLLVDDRARNTYENAINARALAQPREGQTWLLVTSAWHMPRAIGVFNALGWKVVPYPADYALPPQVPFYPELRGFLGNFEYAHLALHEWGGIAVYALTDRWRAVLSTKPVDKRE